MLRILLLFLILRCAAAASEDTEGITSGDMGDEEVDEEEEVILDKTRRLSVNNSVDKSQGAGEEAEKDWTTVIIITAAGIVALALCAVGIIVFRRHLLSREQGVYSMPAEQGQKAPV